MSAMNLNHIKTGLDSPLSSDTERLDGLLDLIDRQGFDLRVRIRKGDRTRTPDVLGPPAGLGGRKMLAAPASVPGRQGAGLAAGVAQLDAGAVALRVDKIDDAPERRGLAVLPEARVLRGDAAVGLDGRRLDDREGGAPRAEGPQVHEVPVG